MLLPLVGEGVDAGEIQGVVLIRQGRIMMLQQEGPAFFIQQAAADGHQRTVSQGAPHIEDADNGLLAGSVLPRHHDRGAALTDVVDVLLIVADATGKAENTAVKALSASGRVEKRMPTWLGERSPPGVEEERGIIEAASGNALGADGVKHPV